MIEIPGEFPLPREAFERQRSLLGAYAGASRRASRPKRRRVIAAVAIVLTVLLVAPGLGLGGRLLDLFQSPPAPPEVQTYFAANDEFRQWLFAHAEEAGQELHDQFSPVIASEARGVFAIESPDGPIYLWAAPTEDGRQCWLIQVGVDSATRQPRGLGSCDGTQETRRILPETTWWADLPSVQIVHVRVYDSSIARVDVEVEGASSVSLPVVAGHALGTVAKGERILALVARNADGDEVAKRVLRNAD